MEYTLKLSAQELATIAEALSNAPYRMVATVILKIQQQINEQNAQAVPEKPAGSNGKEAHP
jgi:hypothetical protein